MVLERLRAEVDAADNAYRESQLECGGDIRSEELRAAFGSMADTGEAAVDRMRVNASKRSPTARFEIATDVQAFEELISQWRLLSDGR